MLFRAVSECFPCTISRDEVLYRKETAFKQQKTGTRLKKVVGFVRFQHICGQELGNFRLKGAYLDIAIFPLRKPTPSTFISDWLASSSKSFLQEAGIFGVFFWSASIN